VRGWPEGRRLGGVRAWEEGSCQPRAELGGQAAMVGLQGCPSICLILSSLSPLQDTPALRFTQVSVLSPGCCLCVRAASALPHLPRPGAAGDPPHSNVPVLGLQGTCWPCFSGCSLPSRRWPSCCTSTSTAARTHGE